MLNIANVIHMSVVQLRTRRNVMNGTLCVSSRFIVHFESLMWDFYEGTYKVKLFSGLMK